MAPIRPRNPLEQIEPNVIRARANAAREDFVEQQDTHKHRTSEEEIGARIDKAYRRLDEEDPDRGASNRWLEALRKSREARAIRNAEQAQQRDEDFRALPQNLQNMIKENEDVSEKLRELIWRTYDRSDDKMPRPKVLRPVRKAVKAYLDFSGTTTAEKRMQRTQRFSKWKAEQHAAIDKVRDGRVAKTSKSASRTAKPAGLPKSVTDWVHSPLALLLDKSIMCAKLPGCRNPPYLAGHKCGGIRIAGSQWAALTGIVEDIEARVEKANEAKDVYATVNRMYSAEHGHFTWEIQPLVALHLG